MVEESLIEVLMREHRHIEAVAGACESLARTLDAGDPIDVYLPRRIAHFMQDYADCCHHNKEEELLFPALEAEGFPRDGCPLGVMRHEHEEARKLVARLRAGSHGAELSGLLRAVASTYADHIHKEDRVLYPLAQKALPQARQEQLRLDFLKADAAFGAERRHCLENFAGDLAVAYPSEPANEESPDARRRTIVDLARSCRRNS